MARDTITDKTPLDPVEGGAIRPQHLFILPEDPAARLCWPRSHPRAEDHIGPIDRFDPFGAYAAYGCLVLLLLGAIAAAGAAVAPYLFAAAYLLQ